MQSTRVSLRTLFFVIREEASRKKKRPAETESTNTDDEVSVGDPPRKPATGASKRQHVAGQATITPKPTAKAKAKEPTVTSSRNSASASAADASSTSVAAAENDEDSKGVVVMFSAFLCEHSMQTDAVVSDAKIWAR